MPGVKGLMTHCTCVSITLPGSPDVLTIIGDLTIETDCERVMKSTIDKYGQLNVLVRQLQVVFRIPGTR